MTSCIPRFPNKNDRSLFITLKDIEKYTSPYQYDTSLYENSYKSLWLDFSTDLNYEFSTPDTENERPLQIKTDISCFAPKKNRSLEDLIGQGIYDAILGFHQIHAEEANEIFHYKNSHMQILKNENEQPVGHIFYYYGKTCSYAFFLKGYYIKDTAVWEKLLLPKLGLLDETREGFYRIVYPENR